MDGTTRGAPGPDGLLEREAEVATLASALAAARRGAGDVLVVEGPAGIGKSQLLAATRADAERSGMVVCRARGIPLERDVPFGLATGLFASRLATAPEEERARLLSGSAALAASLFDPLAPAPQDPGALVRGLYWLSVNLATETRSADGRPGALLIEVDDIHWADRRSVAFLAFLAARIEELPAVLAVALRTGEPDADHAAFGWLRDRPGAVLRLRPLSGAAVDRLVASELPGAEPAFVQACAEVTGGNPFLARELVRTLRTDGVSPTAASAPQVRRLLPDSVLHSVLVRLARLGEPARRLAEAVAVLGDGTPLRRARLLAGLEPDVAEAAADALAGASLLAPGEPVRFAHPLIANAVASDLPAFARARAHHRAATLLTADGAPVDAVAAHLLLTRPEDEPETASILRRAADQARGRGDQDAAARLLARALEEPPPQADRGRVLLDLADVEMARGDAAAAAHLEQALALASTPPERVAALVAGGHFHFLSGEHVNGAAALDEALGLLAPTDPARLSLLGTYLTLTTFRSALHPLGEELIRPVVEAARRGDAPDDPGLLAHLVLRLTFAAGEPEVIRSLAERATAADPLVDPSTHGMLMGIVVQALCSIDELDLAARICDRALTAARATGSVHAYSLVSYHRAIAEYHRGEFTEALADLDQAMTASREGWGAADAWTGGLQVHVQLERGNLAAAREALTLTEGASDDAMDMAVALFARARVALAENRPAVALADAQSAGKALRGFGIDHPGFVPWRQVAAGAAAATGDPELARSLADEMLERARWSGSARALGSALRTKAAVSDDVDRPDLLAEATEILTGSPSFLQRAHALVELGAARRRAGQRSAAQQPLREGLQLAGRMGARPLIETARHELNALGVKPRRSASTGPEALTPTETRVAELAGEGLSNPQIAQALFVTSKTVSTHLAHAYRKLSITSRNELPRVLSRRDAAGC